MKKQLTLCLLFLSIFLTTGCSSGPEFKTGTINGVAKIDNHPFNADAVLMFLDNTTGQAYTAPIATDGKFAVKEKVRVGTYVVYLAPKPPAAGSSDAQPMAVKIDTSVPDKYWNEATSDLKVTVNEGENSPTLVFEKS